MKRDARAVAARVLHRVAERGAWASPALDAEIGRAGLAPRDAALATEIVYGALRTLPRLDDAYGAHVRKRGAMDGLARAALRAATYQILHLRAPPHAAVDAAVDLVRRERDPRLAGFVNAVLRKVAAERPVEPAPPSRIEAPPWLARGLLASIGEERTALFLGARPLPPPIGLAVRLERTTRAEVEGAIRAARPEAEVVVSPVAPGALLVRHGGDPRTLPGYREGLFAVQEHGSQIVARLAGALPGERVLDACAGRGGKTVELAVAVGAGGSVTALDRDETKLDRIGPELQRLAVSTAHVSTLAVDLTVGTGGLDGRFDRVLVDAPCSGLGTVHRRPELLLRVGEEDPARMAEVQRSILERAVQLVRPGGLLFYAVCSPMAAEGAGAIAGLGLAPAAGPWSVPGITPDPDGAVRLGPWFGDMDCFQIFRLQTVG